MTITIAIDCDNAAFDGSTYCGAEIARILRTVGSAAGAAGSRPVIRRELSGLKLRDSNGNTVGAVTVTEGEG